MAGATVKIDDREIRGLLSAMLVTLGNLKPAMEEIGEHVVTSILENFGDRSGPDGSPWEPVSDDYAAWKAKKGHSADDILVFSSDLLKSISPKAKATSVEVGTGPYLVYAAIHQFGGRTGRSHASQMPARPYMGVKDTDWPEMQRILLKYLLKKKAR